ncbi:MAG: molybdate ABC transporter substrate-binding protein [Candidatus Eisenbacteria bacterium]
MRRAAYSILLGIGLLSCGNGAGRGPGEVVVFAASSLTEPFRALEERFEISDPAWDLSLVFAGSHTLATQILEGAPADLFVSADRRQMDRIGSLAEPPVPFATNRLVVLVPAGNPGGIGSPADLGAEGVRVVLAHRECPAGAYAARQLGMLGIRDEVEANVVSREETVRGVVGKVILGEADGGIVYVTDVTAAVARETETIEFPEGGRVRTVCFAAVMREAPRREGAEAFLEYLVSQEGRAVLESFGFSAP